MKNQILRKIPAVNDFLETKKCQQLIKEYSRPLVLEGIRKVTDQIRQIILDEDRKDDIYKIIKGDLKSDFSFDLNQLLSMVEEYLLDWDRPNLQPAVNATGVVVHTNLGRSLLANSACEALQDVARNYSTLEIDTERGKRGSRYDNVQDLLQKLTGAEDSLVVNNNAGAVLLALNTLAEDQEVIIPRGELVEIGGSFRIPDVMKRSGAKLVEIGATNKVYIDDYKDAVNENTGLLLKVHTSNYRIMGFTRGVDLKELIEFAHSRHLPVLDDLGSGILVDLTDYGFSYEPTVQERIKAGADVVTFSGDKLLGGPQAGIIVGKKRFISKMKKNPLNRALRVDKFTLAALEATLKEYKDFSTAIQNIPTLKMLTSSEEKIEEKANQLLNELREIGTEQFKINKRKDISRVGGGAFPLEELPTWVLELDVKQINAEQLSYELRNNFPPIFTRIANEKVLLDMRTIKKEDYPIIVDKLADLID